MVVKIHLYLLLVFAYMYAINKLEIFVLSYIFIIMHEMAHIAVAQMLGISIREVELLPVGINAKIEKNISFYKELLISLAGPIASLLFSLFLKNSLLKFINLYIALTNLIPLKPYDGGKILNVIIIILFGEAKGRKIKVKIQKIMLNMLTIIALFSVLKFKNYYLAIVCIYMICIAKDELKNERFNDLIKYLQID